MSEISEILSLTDVQQSTLKLNMGVLTKYVYMYLGIRQHWQTLVSFETL